MKQKCQHKVFSLLMAFVVLFSTLSFTVESHYCGSRLVDTAVFTKLKSCIAEMENKTPIKKGCCKDEVAVVKGQDELKLNSFDDLKFEQQLFLTALVSAYRTLYVSLPKQIIPHKEYSPPNLIYDIQVLDETFLI